MHRSLKRTGSTEINRRDFMASVATLGVRGGAFTGAVDAAQIYQANAVKAGINLKVERVPADGYWNDVWMKKPFCASPPTGAVVRRRPNVLDRLYFGCALE